MSTYQYENFVDPTLDGGELNIWDAHFKNIHLWVPTAETITVDAEWEANLPGLAAAKLGSRYLWWALMMYNGLQDPIADMKPGKVLNIPDASALVTFLNSSKSASTGTNYLPSTTSTII